MQENIELVQKGFRILVSVLSGYVCREYKRRNRDGWWSDILFTLRDPKDLPSYGEDAELMDSLDMANCIRLLTYQWNELFADRLSLNCRHWANELMGVRNVVAHCGQKDLDQHTAERALDTMTLLCNEIDPDSAEELRELYEEMRSRAGETAQPQIIYRGADQPVSESSRGELTEGSLLQWVDTDCVQRTALTRKVTYGGKTTVYPVYKVRLDSLYYNDQNDRIATWISRYEAENGEGSLENIDIGIYNNIIENFIVESNPEALNKTQKNIGLVGQREPGVTLADGRIVDGNRRYTCLRRLQREKNEPLYFETVIMDMDIREDKKQIKLLELSIQHGEEAKVEYDLIDYAIGTWRDVVQTNLLTVEEYAGSTGEAPADVRKRIEIAQLISEFLEFLKLPGQYYAAREYQVYSLFEEMMTPLRQLKGEEKEQLKKVVFTNAMMKAIPDQRKFIRDIKGLVKNDAYASYFMDQETLIETIRGKYDPLEIRSKEDADRFAAENSTLAEELQLSLERALLRSRSKVLKNKPGENVAKCIALMTEIDPHLLGRLDLEEKENLKMELEELIRIADSFRHDL